MLRILSIPCPSGWGNFHLKTMVQPLIQFKDVFKKKFGFTAVMISHEIPDVFYFPQRIVMLDQGKIRFEGAPKRFGGMTTRWFSSSARAWKNRVML